MVLVAWSWVGVPRPTKVENTCLLKPPSMMTSGLPPAIQISCRTFLSWLSVNARGVPSTRVLEPSAEVGSAAPPAEPLSVLVLIQDRTDAYLRATPSPVDTAN